MTICARWIWRLWLSRHAGAARLRPNQFAPTPPARQKKLPEAPAKPGTAGAKSSNLIFCLALKAAPDEEKRQGGREPDLGDLDSDPESDTAALDARVDRDGPQGNRRRAQALSMQ